MWNEPTVQELSQIPRRYSTEETPLKEKIIHMHFFFGGCDWFAAEFDGEDLFFGFAILNNDLEMAEWGYFSLNDLKSIRVQGLEIDRDLYWEIRPAKEVKLIKQARGY